MDSKPTLQWSTSSIALDPRVPVYLDDFLKFDSESFDVIFMDPEAGPKLLSFGLRGMQDFLLNTLSIVRMLSRIWWILLLGSSLVSWCACARMQ